MKNCSKCGGSPALVIKEAAPYGIKDGAMMYYYQCQGCGFRTVAGVSGYNGLMDYTTTENQARKNALANWNDQITVKDVVKQGQEQYRQLRKEGRI